MIYLDNAATTQVKRDVLAEMVPYFRTAFANPSAVYDIAIDNKEAIEKARKQIADLIGAKPEEIYFTSGGSESDNWAIKGIAENRKERGRHIITSKIEHHAVLNTCAFLEKNGYDVTYLDVDSDGKIKLDELKSAIRDDTILISIMAANNEIGTIQPIKEIGDIAFERGIVFHTDAVQVCGHIPLNVNEMNIDLLAASGHKFGAPKGIGFLFIRNGIKIEPLIHGGSQENGMRAGTYNVPGIVGMGKAAELTNAICPEQVKLRDYVIDRILHEIPNTKLNGHRTDRLPSNINITFGGIQGEVLLAMLNQLGIYVSSGSACASGTGEISHVLKAIGLTDEEAHGSIRISLGEDTDMEDVNYLVNQLKKIIKEYGSIYE